MITMILLLILIFQVCYTVYEIKKLKDMLCVLWAFIVNNDKNREPKLTLDFWKAYHGQLKNKQ